MPLTAPGLVYDGAVTRSDLDEWHSELNALFARMGQLFYRPESRKHAEQYMRGLLAPLQRKNGWTIAEYVGESEPKALQRFLNLSPWDVDRLLGSQSRLRDGTFGVTRRDPGGRSDRFREKGHQIGGGAEAVFGNAGPDRQLPDRHLPGLRHTRARSGAARPATVPAGGVLAGRSGPLRRGRRTTGHSLQDQATAGHRDDRGGAHGRAYRSPGSPPTRNSGRTPDCGNTWKRPASAT